MQYPGSILLHPAYCRLYTTRRSYNVSHRIPRVGVGGPVGSGKTALIEALVPMLLAEGYAPLVITNDIVTREDAEHVKRTLAGVLDPERVVGVFFYCCRHPPDLHSSPTRRSSV